MAISKRTFTAVARLDATSSNPVTLNSLLSGEDQVNDWLQIANGASQYYAFKALSARNTSGVDATTFGAVNGGNGRLIGIAGAAGDYLERLVCSVHEAVNSRVLLQDHSAATLISTGAATWSSGTPTAFTFAHSAAAASIADTLIGQYLIATYTLNGVPVLLARVITDVPTVTANTSYVLTIDAPTIKSGSGATLTPTAAVTTAATHFIAPLIKVLGANEPVGVKQVSIQAKSKYGGWRIHTDSGVSVIAIGKFS